jgi:hypothetical protein
MRCIKALCPSSPPQTLPTPPFRMQGGLAGHGRQYPSPAAARAKRARSLTAGRAAAWGRDCWQKEVALSCIGLHAPSSHVSTGAHVDHRRRGRRPAPKCRGAAHTARRARGGDVPGGGRAGREGGGGAHDARDEGCTEHC